MTFRSFEQILTTNTLEPRASFLAEIRQSFLTRASTEADYFIIVLAAVTFLIVLAIIVTLFRRKRINYIPYGWITDSKQILMVLNLALDQRSTFELQFPSEASKRRPVLRCSGHSVKGRELLLEAYGIQNLAKEWQDREVEIYFKISSEGQFVYYAVNSKIKYIQVSSSERCIITLYEIEKLENRQKRAFLRITPPEEYLLGAAMWYRTQPEDDVVGDSSLWPKPDLALIPGKIEQFSIIDLSAGGMRLCIPRKSMVDWEEKFAISERVYFLISLLEPDERKRIRFWLQCRIQNLSVEFASQNIDLGLQFMAWATIREGSGATLEWLKLTRNLEVDPLGNWVIRRHLELFREEPDVL